MLPPVSALAARLGNGLDLLRVSSLQGQIAAGLGRTDEAVTTLAGVRDEFLELGIVYDAALATLELAVVLAEQGRTAEVRELRGSDGADLRGTGSRSRRPWRPRLVLPGRHRGAPHCGAGEAAPRGPPRRGTDGE